jgi:hypothetical protein
VQILLMKINKISNFILICLLRWSPHNIKESKLITNFILNSTINNINKVPPKNIHNLLIIIPLKSVLKSLKNIHNRRTLSLITEIYQKTTNPTILRIANIWFTTKIKWCRILIIHMDRKANCQSSSWAISLIDWFIFVLMHL